MQQNETARVRILATAELRCGHCGRTVRGEYKAQDPAPCGCDWTWIEGTNLLEASPSRHDWPRIAEQFMAQWPTPAEIAAATGTAESTWRNKAAAGKIPGAIKKGKQWLIPRAWVDEAIAQGRIGTRKASQG